MMFVVFTFCPVTSGVPQDSVLGIILFLIYINGIDTNIQSQICLLANDTTLTTDTDILHADIQQLQKLCVECQMAFQPAKG